MDGGSKNMSTDINNLLASLNQLIVFLEKIPVGNEWIQPLSDIRLKISTTSSRLEGVDLLSTCFGGMGSLNDIFFDARNRNIPDGYTAEEANKKFEELLNALYENLKSADGKLFDHD